MPSLLARFGGGRASTGAAKVHAEGSKAVMSAQRQQDMMDKVMSAPGNAELFTQMGIKRPVEAKAQEDARSEKMQAYQEIGKDGMDQALRMLGLGGKVPTPSETQTQKRLQLPKEPKKEMSYGDVFGKGSRWGEKGKGLGKGGGGRGGGDPLSAFADLFGAGFGKGIGKGSPEDAAAAGDAFAEALAQAFARRAPELNAAMGKGGGQGKGDLDPFLLQGSLGPLGKEIGSEQQLKVVASAPTINSSEAILGTPINGLGVPPPFPVGKGGTAKPRYSAGKGSEEHDKEVVMEAMGQIMQGLMNVSAAGFGSRSSPPHSLNLPVRREPLQVAGSHMELKKLQLSCQTKPWMDRDFPATFNQHVKQWCRPAEITASDFTEVKRGSTWHLFRYAKPSVTDAKQGMVGDCWLISSLAAVSEFQGGRCAKALLPRQNDLCPAGIYLVRLCLAGIWREIFVDDRLPCVGGDEGYATHAAYAQTVKRQIWVSIVEKAYAKASGSYESLSGGKASEALTVLTGWPCTELLFGRHGSPDANAAWAELTRSKRAGFLLTCTSQRDTAAMAALGLVQEHEYSILDLLELKVEPSPSKGGTKARASKKVRLVKLRNPQGNAPERTWTGAWSPDSREWTPRLRKMAGCENGATEQGVFFVCFEDFERHFDHVTTCCIRPSSWTEQRVTAELPQDLAQLPCGWVLEVGNDSPDVSLALHQAERRIRRGPFCNGVADADEDLMQLGFVVLFVAGMESQESVLAMPCAAAVARVRLLASAYVELQGVSVGTYIVVPLAGSISPRKGPANITLSCRSSKPVSVSSIPELEASKVREAWAAYAVHRDEDEKELGFACLQAGGPENAGTGEVLLTRGGLQSSCLVILAAAERGWMRVELPPTTSRCLRSSRGGSVDWVGPGHAQVVQVIFLGPEPMLRICQTFASQLTLTTTSSPPPSASKASALTAKAGALTPSADAAVERRHKPALGKAGFSSLFAPFRVRPESSREPRLAERRDDVDDSEASSPPLPPHDEPLPWVPKCSVSIGSTLICSASAATVPARFDCTTVHL